MSGFADYRKYDALGLAALVRAGEISPAELLETAIETAERVNPAINALSQKLYEHGRAALATIDRTAPFAGVPFLLKDVSAMLQGTRTTQGSRLFADAPPAARDTTLVERHKRAGLVIFGKTTTPELGLAPATETSLTGATRNPWDLARTPGGSSGGAAAAVAAGVTPIAHASDGGGSIRIPASCCGLFGLKPTRARTPAGPLVGEGWGGLSVQHIVSRSVRDSAAMLDATAGPADGDPYCAPTPERPFLREAGEAPRRLRIALQSRPMSGVAVDPDCRAALDEAARLVESLGHEVEEAELPGSWPELSRALWVLVAANVSLALKRRAAALSRKLQPGDVDPVTWEAVDSSAGFTGEDYPAALFAIHAQGRAMAAFHRRFDIVMSPTLAQAPPPLGVLSTESRDLSAYGRALTAFMPFTQVFNMTGQPSMTVPLHWNEAGLPIGVMFSAPFGDEATLFRLAGQLEAARPWFDRTPGMVA